MSAPELGKIGWVDLTVPDAEKLRDFYREVVGWSITPVKMSLSDLAALEPEAPARAPSLALRVPMLPNRAMVC